LAIDANPGNSVLAGQTTVPVVAGEATFSDLSIFNVENGYTLEATADQGYTPDTSNSFNITDPGSIPSAEWTERFDGPLGGSDTPTDIIVDRWGNVYVTGSGVGSGEDIDFLTVKYDRSGNEVWVASYQGTGSGTDSARAIGIDHQGNIYVAGQSDGSSTTDCATIKYDNAGTQIWVVRDEGTGRLNNVKAMAIKYSTGDVYVTGQSNTGPTQSKYKTIKYDTTGSEVWAVTYIGPGDGADAALDIAVDSTGGVYVTGSSYGSDQVQSKH